MGESESKGLLCRGHAGALSSWSQSLLKLTERSACRLHTLAHHYSDMKEDQALSSPLLTECLPPTVPAPPAPRDGDGTMKGKVETGLWCPLLFSTSVPRSE